MKMKSILLLVLTFASVAQVKSQKNPPSETEKIVDDFFKIYRESGHQKAITLLLGSNKWISEKDAENVATKMTDIISQVGQYYGSEKISERHYGQSIVQYIYIVRYERQPLRFIFRFYRPSDKWQTQGFEYEVDFLDELKDVPKSAQAKGSDN